MNRFVSASILACLLPSLIGCVAKPVTVTRIVPVLPPISLIQDCPAPALAGDTFGDVVGLTVDLQEALATCNADKASLRKWRADHGRGSDGAGH